MKDPLVSVYIPTHNRAHLIERAIQSVLNQTYSNIEIIVVDDASSDKTPHILKKLSEKNQCISFFSLGKPKGACAARNLAISKAKGKFITGLDDDDLFLPHRIADFLDEYNERYSFICSSRLIKTASGTMQSLPGTSVITFQDIKNNNYVGNQIFIERSRITKNLLYSEEMPAWQDYDLWFRLIKAYGPALKINNHSYEVDLTASNNRISQSSNAYKGFKLFIERHKSELTDSEIKKHTVNDLYNRHVKLSIANSLRYAHSIYAVKKLASLYILTRWPKLHQRIVDCA